MKRMELRCGGFAAEVQKEFAVEVGSFWQESFARVRWQFAKKSRSEAEVR